MVSWPRMVAGEWSEEDIFDKYLISNIIFNKNFYFIQLNGRWHHWDGTPEKEKLRINHKSGLQHVQYGVLIGLPSRNVELEADYLSRRFRKGN